MTTIIVIAVIGWFLFLVTFLFYWEGNRLNVQESNALATYSLALLISDEFGIAIRSGFDTAIEEARSRGSDPKAVTYGLIEATTESAKSFYKPNSDINMISIITDFLAKKV